MGRSLANDYLFSDYTGEIDGGGIERRTRYKSKNIFCRAHHSRIYLDGKSAGPLEANVNGLATSGRYVASSQEVENRNRDPIQRFAK